MTMPDSIIPPRRVGAIAGLPMEHYLADPGVAAHDCWNLHSRCPAYAWARCSTNPKREPEKESDALTFGQALHALVLEGPQAFHERFVVKPEGLSLASKDGRAWRDGEVGDRDILSADDGAMVFNIAQAIRNHPLASRSLAKTEREVTMYADDPATGLRIKNRPDAMGPYLAVNIKTTLSAEPRAWKRQAVALGYHVSQAMTARVRAALGYDVVPYVFLVAEKGRNPIVQLYELDDALGLLGEQIVDRALRQWAKCAETGVWPAYREGVWRIGADKWDVEEIERMQREGDDA